MNKIPKYLNYLFWDINIESFDPLEYPQYTIGRFLEFGDEKGLAWIKETFSEEQIKSVIKSGRRLSPKSANFWALVYGIPRCEISILNK